MVMNYIVEEPSIANNSVIPTTGKTDIYNYTSVPTTKTSEFISIGNVIAILMMVFIYRKMK